MLQATIPHRLEIIDIDNDPKLQLEYGFEIPVVAVGPYRLKAPFSQKELQMTLLAAKDRERHMYMVERSPALEEVRRRGVWSGADKFTYWISRHYLKVFNLFVFIYLGLAFLAPVLVKFGAEKPANVLYRAYSLVCHQLSFRSLFLFGEQHVYPRQAAGVDTLLTYSQATGLGETSSAEDLFTARTFVGDEHVGYKVALCQRDIAIYGGILIFGLLFGLVGRRLPAVPWYLWLGVGILPIAVDGISQLLSQPPFRLWDFRESTPKLRYMTGFLFGFFTAWFGYPMVEETMADTRQIMKSKLKRVHKDPDISEEEYVSQITGDTSQSGGGEHKPL
jgi:uncharacterized membrane protein